MIDQEITISPKFSAGWRQSLNYQIFVPGATVTRTVFTGKHF